MANPVGRCYTDGEPMVFQAPGQAPGRRHVSTKAAAPIDGGASGKASALTVSHHIRDPKKGYLKGAAHVAIRSPRR